MQNKDQFSAFDVSVSQGDHDRQPSLEVETTTTAVVSHMIDAAGVKTKLAQTVRLLSFIRIISLLAQGIVAILHQKKGQHVVFGTMYGFSLLSGIFDVVGIFNYYVTAVGVLGIQTALSVLFMWACNWTFVPMVVFCVLGFIQLSFEDLFYTYMYMHILCIFMNVV
ncbi:hypothetical protein RFI_16884 [Reticulomyxa filosa]|uniref:Uncharacterized protein n=1 Tax=Reticulomyxa filosa TaxID=46433 RepID=X6N3K2_RETFI|nr:hypothetical protein RFI_16884 [Reticulomyxa filosa]|eukprot:ETO20334.1 hypothetical protein RFI_16884 [Reticulomyxa filosa]